MTAMDFDGFRDPGLYLLWDDATRLDLTAARVHEATERMLADPAQIPESVRAATEYQPCVVCPERETAQICHAIMPALPFLEHVDAYMSYDAVTAVYRAEGEDVLHIRRTTMQEALKHVAILSLVHYCEHGRQFAPYFKDINPLMPPRTIAAAIYRNMHVAFGGDLQAMQTAVSAMGNSILLTTRCQMDRLRLIAKRDAFLNAYVSTQTTTQFLLMDLEEHIRTASAMAPSRQGAAAGMPAG